MFDWYGTRKLNAAQEQNRIATEHLAEATQELIDFLTEKEVIIKERIEVIQDLIENVTHEADEL